ncbi:hypothetical protein JL720_17253 [Aureococcus anophagefferens]|nr:hypothetical protein JL720_17253 [Aureococcus anophagefferens]
MDQEKVDGLVFSSNFDSGNLQSAERAKDGAWELTIAKDCEGTEFERRSSTWFYFRVRDEREAELSIAKRDKRGARFRFTGMSRQGALYKNGMRPVVRRLTEKRAAGGASCWAGLAGDGGWKRLPTGVCYREQSDRTGDLQFDWNFGTLGEEVEFAFCYPYAYEERDGSSLRPEVYPDKPEVLVSARVHPGETPASFVLDGLLELLLRPDDRRAKLLRRKYVWRFVPQLNPDGVARATTATTSSAST